MAGSAWGRERKDEQLRTDPNNGHLPATRSNAICLRGRFSSSTAIIRLMVANHDEWLGVARNIAPDNALPPELPLNQGDFTREQ